MPLRRQQPGRQAGRHAESLGTARRYGLWSSNAPQRADPERGMSTHPRDNPNHGKGSVNPPGAGSQPALP
jgi:hypothetical protein